MIPTRIGLPLSIVSSFRTRFCYTARPRYPILERTAERWHTTCPFASSRGSSVAAGPVTRNRLNRSQPSPDRASPQPTISQSSGWALIRTSRFVINSFSTMMLNRGLGVRPSVNCRGSLLQTLPISLRARRQSLTSSKPLPYSTTYHSVPPASSQASNTSAHGTLSCPMGKHMPARGSLGSASVL